MISIYCSLMKSNEAFFHKRLCSLGPSFQLQKPYHLHHTCPEHRLMRWVVPRRSKVKVAITLARPSCTGGASKCSNVTIFLSFIHVKYLSFILLRMHFTLISMHFHPHFNSFYPHFHQFYPHFNPFLPHFFNVVFYPHLFTTLLSFLIHFTLILFHLSFGAFWGYWPVCISSARGAKASSSARALRTIAPHRMQYLELI